MESIQCVLTMNFLWLPCVLGLRLHCGCLNLDYIHSAWWLSWRMFAYSLVIYQHNSPPIFTSTQKPSSGHEWSSEYRSVTASLNNFHLSWWTFPSCLHFYPTQPTENCNHCCHCCPLSHTAFFYPVILHFFYLRAFCCHGFVMFAWVHTEWDTSLCLFCCILLPCPLTFFFLQYLSICFDQLPVFVKSILTVCSLNGL